MTGNGVEKKTEIKTEVIGEDVYHKVKGLPSLSDLNDKVRAIVQQSSYWDRYGSGLVSIGFSIPLHLLGLYLCSSNNTMLFITGFVMPGFCHSVIANRAGHLASHNALFKSPSLNKFTRWFTVEFIGFYSIKSAMRAHIYDHHPYTNIIGIGDSATWKSPSLPRYVYMFVAPVSLPILAPLISIKDLSSQPRALLLFLCSIFAGLVFNLYLIMMITGFTSLLNATIFLCAYRSLTSFTFIHVNIFQHIGLPMYTLEDKPAKLYQMSTGVLNLNSNAILDWIMGHTLFYCHIEHHFYPSLSDAMCLKIKPIVKQFLLDNGLPYHEKPYTERLSLFIHKYEELMVKAPPFTHFVGLQ